jgi:hypothetical protein
MICKSCKADVAHGAKFCPECGEKFSVDPPPCPACGAANASASKFCAECGASQQAVAAAPASPALVAAPVTASPPQDMVAPPPVMVAPPPVMVAPAPAMAPPAAKMAEAQSADARITDTEEFWGPDPKYGKVPWGEFAFLVLAIVLTFWNIIGNGPYATSALGGIAVIATILRIVDRFGLKATKHYYSISPIGLSYCTATGSMNAVAWAEMKRIDRMDDIGQQLKLTWMGVRGDKNVPKWMDRLLTRLTGKVHKGGVPVEDNARVERVVVLDGSMMTSQNLHFGDRFQACFQQLATAANANEAGNQR